MTRVAVLQFPGINSEYETLRALWDAKIDAEFFRWNQSASALNEFDGFVIPGGFSYEDRGRAGLIASMDPVMDAIKKQAEQKKPVLGICNGAQILVESGLIPGGDRNQLLMCLARNKRMKDGEIFGTGFYNENIYLKSEAPKGRTAFTLDYEPGEVNRVPVAHGEGRFTTSIPGLLETLRANNQIVFRYCTRQGQIDPNFPVNPNGAMDNAAAICNPFGNVMAIMPHPERSFTAPMPKIFSSMRAYMQGAKLIGSMSPLIFEGSKPPLADYAHKPNTIELYVRLIITDNEAQTLENALRQKGFPAALRKWTHFEIEHPEGVDQNALAKELIASGELLNTNKETVQILLDQQGFAKNPSFARFLSRDIEDSIGASKTAKLSHHLGKEKVTKVSRGLVWEIARTTQPEAILATNILANPHAQLLYKVS